MDKLLLKFAFSPFLLIACLAVLSACGSQTYNEQPISQIEEIQEESTVSNAIMDHEQASGGASYEFYLDGHRSVLQYFVPQRISQLTKVELRLMTDTSSIRDPCHFLARDEETFDVEVRDESANPIAEKRGISICYTPPLNRFGWTEIVFDHVWSDIEPGRSYYIYVWYGGNALSSSPNFAWERNADTGDFTYRIYGEEATSCDADISRCEDDDTIGFQQRDCSWRREDCREHYLCREISSTWAECEEGANMEVTDVNIQRDGTSTTSFFPGDIADFSARLFNHGGIRGTFDTYFKVFRGGSWFDDIHDFSGLEPWGGFYPLRFDDFEIPGDWCGQYEFRVSTDPCYGSSTCQRSMNFEVRGTCPEFCTDNDGDGYGENCDLGSDCNDNNDSVHPGAVEQCNNRDDDCDGSITDENQYCDTNQNCGSFGNNCDDGFNCVNGECVPSTPIIELIGVRTVSGGETRNTFDQDEAMQFGMRVRNRGATGNFHYTLSIRDPRGAEVPHPWESDRSINEGAVPEIFRFFTIPPTWEGNYTYTYTISGVPCYNDTCSRSGSFSVNPPPCIDNDGDGYGEDCGLGVDCDDNNSSVHQNITCSYNGSACGNYSLCVAQCPTPPGETCNGEDDDCDDATDEIFDFNTDNNNCGWCGNNCSGTQDCRNGRCENACVNECIHSAQRECVGNSWRACGNHDDDPCLEWSSLHNCHPLMCNGGECVLQAICEDEDEDGYRVEVNPVGTTFACPGPLGQGQDCNDNDPEINPGVDEEDYCYDNKDNDCDGKIDGYDSECGGECETPCEDYETCYWGECRMANYIQCIAENVNLIEGVTGEIVEDISGIPGAMNEAVIEGNYEMWPIVIIEEGIEIVTGYYICGAAGLLTGGVGGFTCLVVVGGTSGEIMDAVGECSAEATTPDCLAYCEDDYYEVLDSGVNAGKFVCRHTLGYHPIEPPRQICHNNSEYPNPVEITDIAVRATDNGNLQFNVEIVNHVDWWGAAGYEEFPRNPELSLFVYDSDDENSILTSAVHPVPSGTRGEIDSIFEDVPEAGESVELVFEIDSDPFTLYIKNEPQTLNLAVWWYGFYPPWGIAMDPVAVNLDDVPYTFTIENRPPIINRMICTALNYLSVPCHSGLEIYAGDTLEITLTTHDLDDADFDVGVIGDVEIEMSCEEIDRGKICSFSWQTTPGDIGEHNFIFFVDDGYDRVEREIDVTVVENTIDISETDDDDDEEIFSPSPDESEVAEGGEDDDDLVIDDDNDNMPDSDEIEWGLNPLDADCDDDGVADGDEPEPFEDTDGDGLINALDPDSDNDGVPDGVEMGITEPVLARQVLGTDPSVSAAANIFDKDPSTTTDPLKVDTDGGGLTDGREDININGKLDAGERDPLNPNDDTLPSFLTGGHGGGCSLVLPADMKKISK